MWSVSGANRFAHFFIVLHSNNARGGRAGGGGGGGAKALHFNSTIHFHFRNGMCIYYHLGNNSKQSTPGRVREESEREGVNGKLS